MFTEVWILFEMIHHTNVYYQKMLEEIVLNTASEVSNNTDLQ